MSRAQERDAARPRSKTAMASTTDTSDVGRCSRDCARDVTRVTYTQPCRAVRYCAGAAGSARQRHCENARAKRPTCLDAVFLRCSRAVDAFGKIPTLDISRLLKTNRFQQEGPFRLLHVHTCSYLYSGETMERIEREFD